MCPSWNQCREGWKKSESESHSVMSYSLRSRGLKSSWNSPGQNTGVGSFSFLQGIFPTQGSNPGLLHCRQILCKLSHKGRPRILEWVAFPFSRGSSLPRNWTRFSCIAGGFFTNWAIREGSMSLGPCNSRLYDTGQVSPPPLASVSWSVKYSCW